MTTVLITGGAGFIGSAIVEAALEKGWRVRVLDSLRPDVHGGDYLPDPRVEFVKADVRDPDALAVALFGVDVVCHQAAKVGLGVSFEDAPDYIGSNDLGTAVLLAAMAEFDHALDGCDWLDGEQYTIADIVLLTTIDFATFVGVTMPAELTHLNDWHARASARPSASA